MIRAIFFGALILRLIYVLTGPTMAGYIWSDMRGYINIAEDILVGRWLDTHFFQSIGYPFLIAGAKHLFSNWALGLSVIQAFLSALALLPMYAIAKKSFGDKVALISIIIGSLHVPWILFSKYALPETIFTFLLAVCSWLTMKLVEKPKWYWGACWGITFICALWLKGTHVFWGPIFVLALLYYKRWESIPSLAALCFTVGVGILLHGVLTYKTIGHFQLSASAGGLNFVEGKCFHKKNRDNIGYSWQSPLYFQLHLDEEKQWDKPFTNSKYFMQQGLQCIIKNPLVLIGSLEGIPFLFMGNTLWPLNQLKNRDAVRFYELFFSIFLLMGFICFIFWMMKKKSIETLILWGTPVLAIFLCVYVFKSEVRFRLPYDIWFIPISVAGWVQLKRAFFLEKEGACEGNFSQ